jgi:hypothetical protein
MRWNRGVYSPEPMDIIGTMSSPESEPVRLSSLHERKPENEANGASEFRARWDAIFDPEPPFLETQAEPDGGTFLGEDLSSFLPSADPAAKRRRGSTDPLTEPDDEAQAMPEQGAENGAEGPEVGVENGVENGGDIGAENGMGNGVENGTPAPEELAGKRAPRKKRKWLKKGESRSTRKQELEGQANLVVDPDDTQAVARQRERHEMIDQYVYPVSAWVLANPSGRLRTSTCSIRWSRTRPTSSCSSSGRSLIGVGMCNLKGLMRVNSEYHVDRKKGA